MTSRGEGVKIQHAGIPSCTPYPLRLANGREGAGVPGGTRNAAPPRRRLLGPCRSRAAERNVGFRDRRKGSARERGPLAGRLPVAHVPCGLRLDDRFSSAPRVAGRICSAAISPSSNAGFIESVGSGGVIATNSTLVIPFTSADRRRKVPSTELPS